MKTSSMMTSAMPSAPVGQAWEEVSASFDRFCLAAGIETLGAMMEADAEEACGPRHSRSEDRHGHRWGRRYGKRAISQSNAGVRARCATSVVMLLQRDRHLGRGADRRAPV